MANRFPPASSQIPGMVPSASTAHAMFGGIPTGGHLMGHLPYAVVPQQHYPTIMMPSQPSGAVPFMMPGHLQGVYHLPSQPVLTTHSTMRGAPIVPRSMDEQCQWLEERQKLQERLLKERNYHIQQQRLRDFHPGANQKLQADRLIQDMLGKLEEPRKKTEPPRTTESTVHIPDSKSANGIAEEQKPPPSSSRYQPSQKARDWSNLDDLRNVFSAPVDSPRLPQWCQEGSPVPALYTQVENYITRNGSLDTSLLYPILLSSGLSREMLSQIWSLANRQTPGILNRSELYAILAMVALAQNACQITSLDILHNVQQAPIPLFNQVVTQVPVPQTAAASLSGLQQTQQSEDDDFDDFKCATNIPTQSVPAIMMANSVGSRLANHRTSVSPSPTNQLDLHDGITAPRNASAHWSSAPVSGQSQRTSVSTPSTSTPEILAFPPNLESRSRDDSGFEQSSQWFPLNTFCSSTEVTNSSAATSVPVLPTGAAATSVPVFSSDDLMSTTEDKYSVFRELAASMDGVKSHSSAVQQLEDDYGDFLSGDVDSSVVPSTNHNQAFATATNSELLIVDHFGKLSVASQQHRSTQQAFEFSEFQSAADILKPAVMTSSSSWAHDCFRTTSTVVLPSAPSTENSQPDYTLYKSVATDLSGLHLHSSDDDFGDFVTPSANGNGSNGSGAKTDLDSISLGNNYFKLKDNGSIESQSVSSLDLGVYDPQLGNGLDRHGSVPSLDLKVSGGSEEESRDSPVLDGPGTLVTPTNSTLPTRSSEALPSTIQGLPGQPFDRYSLMRSEKPISTDIHSYEWQRCLDSCYELIRDAFKIFNGISSSSVCKEVISSEEGENYLKNIVEIYRIVQRISISVERCEDLDSKLKTTIVDIESQWNNLTSFLMGSSIFPSDDCFNFSSCILDQNVENLKRSCGVCLLNVDASNRVADDFKLTYGGRQYHATCANFWVNFVDSLLPSLAFKLN